MLSSTFERVFSKVYSKSKGDDTTDSEIMAYSAIAAETPVADDEPAFGSGGAIMEALVQNNPNLATKDPKPSSKK